MTFSVSGQIPVTKDGKDTGLKLGVGVNATTPQVGSKNWEGKGTKGKDQNPTGFFDNLLPTLGQGVGQALGVGATLGV
ncbi:MAG: hypothetical protein ACOYMK_16215, partial [Hyphomonadaceae bacterium]